MNPLLDISTTLWLAVHYFNEVFSLNKNVNFNVIKIRISSLYC